MKCEQIRQRLDDHVSKALHQNDERALRSHLAECAECAAEERGLRALLDQAAELPREMSPGRDLWPGIAARLGRHGKVVRMRPRASHFAWLAAAAVVGLAVSATLTTHNGGMTLSPVTPRLVPASLGAQGVLSMEDDYERAANSLLQAIHRERDGLSPETLKVVQDNLLLIDEALAEVRRALEEDPANRELTSMLKSTHQRKLQTLQQVVRLSQL